MRGRPERRFYFRLARDLSMTVQQMLESISSHEITEWIAYYILEAEDQEAANKRAEMRGKMRR